MSPFPCFVRSQRSASRQQRQGTQAGVSLIELIIAVALLSGLFLALSSLNVNFARMFVGTTNQSLLFQNTQSSMERILREVQGSNLLTISSNSLKITKIGPPWIESEYYLEGSPYELRYRKDTTAPNTFEVIQRNIQTFGLTALQNSRAVRIKLEAKDPQNKITKIAMLQSLAFCRIFQTRPVRVLNSTRTTVKGYYDTIQSAINDVLTVHGDVVQVSSNNQTPYLENINLNKYLVLEGGYDNNNWTRHYADPVNATRIHDNYATIIDGKNTGRAIVCSVSGSNRLVRIDGFVIRNGYSGAEGGGIFVTFADAGSFSSFIISNNTLTQNSATQGGGIYLVTNSSTQNSIRVLNNDITGNTARTYAGGGIVLSARSQNAVVIANNLITSNNSRTSGGGVSVLDNYAGSVLNIFNNRMQNNAVTSNAGFGAMDVSGSGAAFNVSNNDISNNGWGMNYNLSASSTAASSASITNNTITQNTGNGNAQVVAQGSGTFFSFSRNTVTGDTSITNSYGANFNVSGAALGTVSNNLIQGHASTQFGGLQTNVAGAGSRLVISNNLVRGNANSVNSAGGGCCLMAWNSGVLTFTNNTVVENTSNFGSGVVANTSSTPAGTISILNSIIFNNFGTPNLRLQGTTNTMSFSDISGYSGGTGNINLDPRFTNVTNRDYTLIFSNDENATNDSPCVDTGQTVVDTTIPANNYFDPPAPPLHNPPLLTDLAKLPAKATIRTDMGAFGGPGAGIIGFVQPAADDSNTPDIRENVIGTY